MARIVVLGAGVIGRCYAGLLAGSPPGGTNSAGPGNEVTIVARGTRASDLRAAAPDAAAPDAAASDAAASDAAASDAAAPDAAAPDATGPRAPEPGAAAPAAGLIRLELDGRASEHPCTLVASLAEAPPADVLIVAVRGDQLPQVADEVAARPEPIVVCLAAPLGFRDEFRRRVGADRTVFAFAGVGGAIVDGVVRYHRVREQPTVVDVEAPQGEAVARLMADAGLPLRRERAMAAWLDTHALFIAGVGSALVARPGGAAELAGSRDGVRMMVLGLAEAFDVLQRAGVPVRPVALRLIFGRVPLGLATRYWMKKCASPTVALAIEPHVRATRATEFPLVVRYARTLVGDAAPRFERMLEAAATAG